MISRQIFKDLSKKNIERDFRRRPNGTLTFFFFGDALLNFRGWDARGGGPGGGGGGRVLQVFFFLFSFSFFAASAAAAAAAAERVGGVRKGRVPLWGTPLFSPPPKGRPGSGRVPGT